jgi:hypothetical protein
VTLSGLSAEVRRTSAIGWLGRGHKRAGGSRSALIAKLTFDEARGSKVPQSDVLTRTRCGPQIARRTSTRLASSAIAFHGRLRSGGGFCSFHRARHKSRSVEVRSAWRAHAHLGRRFFFRPCLQAKSTPRCKSARSQRKVDISHHEIAPAWAVCPPTLQCDLVM